MPSHIPAVALVRWPEDAASRSQLAAARLPRLLLISAGEAPPVSVDELEDWIRFPLDPQELAVRTETLLERAREIAPRATGLVLDHDGVLHRDDRWVALPPSEARLFRALLEHSSQVVGRSVLTDVCWPDHAPADERAVDGVVKRLRRRIAPLDVRIHTVAGSGFLLDHAEES